MAPETIELLKSLIPVVSALAGGVIGVAGTVFVTFVNKRSEERKHLASLSFNAGIEEFKEAVEVIKAQNKKAYIKPLEFYILNMKYLIDIMNRKLNQKELEKLILEKNSVINDVYSTVLKEQGVKVKD